MQAGMIILLCIVSIILLLSIGEEIRYRYLKKHEKDSKIICESGAFRQSEDCRHQNEYLCVKCGDCGRKFLK